MQISGGIHGGVYHKIYSSLNNFFVLFVFLNINIKVTSQKSLPTNKIQSYQTFWPHSALTSGVNGAFVSNRQTSKGF